MYNKYPIFIFYSEEDNGWIAVSPDFLGMSAFGGTPAQAAYEGTQALDLMCDSCIIDGIPLPQPTPWEELSKSLTGAN